MILVNTGVLCRHLEQILACVVYAVCTARDNGLRFSMLYEYYQQHYPTSVLFQSVLLTLPLNLDPQETPPTPGQEATGSIEDLYCQVSLT